MTAAERTELEEIIQELQRITRQMEELSGQIRTGFAGIGSEYCSKAVELAAAKCRLAQKALKGMADTGF